MRLILGFAAVLCLHAQTQQASIRGTVKDPSGASGAGRDCRLSNRTTQSNNEGRFRFEGLAFGEYTVRASAPQLLLVKPLKVTLSAAAPVADVTLELTVQLANQELNVDERPKTPSPPSPRAMPPPW